MALSVKIESFEGPLDLLLHLIDVNKFNIFDIPIVEITAQYMEYLKSMETEDLNVMSEFLVMAATLRETYFFLYLTQCLIGYISGLFRIFLDDPVNVIFVLLQICKTVL